MKTPLISVIIVTYNSSQYIDRCLKAVFASLKGIASEVIVVDNASDDQTVKRLEKYKQNITLVVSKKNLGFGKANNQGYKNAKGQYIWLVNPDAFVDSSCARVMVSHLQQHPRVGIVGGQMHNVDDTPQASFGYRPTFWRELFQMILLYRMIPLGRVVMPGFLTSHVFNSTHQVSWVSGGCMMIRRSGLGTSKTLFDPLFFMYMEDVDLCLRIIKKGYSVWYLSSAHLTHLHSASFGRGSGRFIYANMLETQSLLQFWNKWYPHQHTRRVLLYLLLKAKLACKLMLVPVGDTLLKKRRMYWKQWHTISL